MSDWPRPDETTADVGDTLPAEPPGGGSLDRGAAVGRYLVLSVIGRGAMGEVYAAYDPELDRRVALKLLHTAGGSEGARQRLVREARALGKLSHPNVVQVHDVGEHHGNVFLTMELVDGLSLDVWTETAPRPGWPEVLGAYLEAARGLSAAHDQGLVHRDVKPSNILRGNDGRVRVVDFGIARGPASEPTEETAGEPFAAAAIAPSVSPLDETLPAPVTVGGTPPGSVERLTAAGAVMGTPLYMAPEQYKGSGVGPASDQYSLCLALYEGLYGAVPFDAPPGLSPVGMLLELLIQKERGVPAVAPVGSPVPAWIHRALLRGLAPSPGDRYPSLTALIAALGEDPDARRRTRRRIGGVTVAAAALLTFAGLRWASSAAPTDPCERPEQQLAGVWDEGVARRMHTAFTSTGRPDAEGTDARVAALFERYSADWAAMRGEVCRASRAASPRRELLGLRDACLDRRRGQLQALTLLLADRPDPEILDRAVPAAAGLSPVSYCADTEALTARVRPPEDPVLRARVAELQPRADRLEALFIAGKYRDGLALGEPLLTETAALAYAPLHAQVQLWMGRLRGATGDYPGAKALLGAAAVSAADGKDEVLSAYAWARLLFVVGNLQRHLDEAAVILTLGPTAVVRAHDDRAEATWLNAEGLTLYRMEKFAEALATHQRALALREKALGPDHVDVAASLNNIGLVLDDLGDYPRALASHERALAIWEKALGQSHPDVARSLNNIGLTLTDVGDYPRALAVFERCLSVLEATVGAAHPEFARSRYNLGVVLEAMGDHPRALAALESAKATWEKSGAMEDIEGAELLAAIGRVQVHLGQLEAGAGALARALALQVKLRGASSATLTDPLLGLGELDLARGKPEEAAAALERALALGGKDTPSVQLTLAEVLWRVGKDRARARRLAEQARAGFDRIGHGPGRGRAAAWLADHPLP